MKDLQHHLFDSRTNKILNLSLQGKKLISEAGNPDKLRIREKEFATPEEALKNFIKKEWDALKKGFVLNGKNENPGEPQLHIFIGGSYTGSLSFQQTPKGIFVYKNAGEKDYLVRIDDQGNIQEEIQLPKQLAWNIEYRADSNSMIMDLDHFIYEYDIEKDTFKNIGGQDRKFFTSFISVSQNRSAYATSGNIYITDNQNNILHTLPYSTETIHGSTPFCGKLSDDGKLLAFHNKPGKIQIIDTTNGALINEISGDFEMIDQMEFADNNNLLVTREHYGTWGMRYFDLSNFQETEISGLQPPDQFKDVNAFCFSADQSKLVLVRRTNAYVFDFNEKKHVHSFTIDHIVKTCNVKFIGKNLGVRTDYGCFSLYNV